MELEKQKNVQIAGQLAPGNPRAVSETGSSIGSRDQSEEISDKIIFPGKIRSGAEMQSVSANKLFLPVHSEINLENELLLDALMTDVDVHSLIDDVAGPQLTGRLGPQHACAPVCTPTTTTTTQPGHQPLLMINDT